METSSVILFYDKCRLCLEKAGFRPIFETEELKRDIFLCTGVKVLSSDNFPQKICYKCLEIVENAKELRKLATKNDTHLRSLFLNDSDEEATIDISLGNADYNENAEKITTFESILSVTEIKDKEEKKKKKSRHRSHRKEEESEKSSQQKHIKVRKDLFNSRSKSAPAPIKVKTKEEYDKIKKRIKYDPEYETVQYECEICNKTFETWKKLYLHTRSHNKKFACPLDACGKMFACKGDLEKHLRTHTGIKPFICDICDKSFTQQETLKVHKETVHYCFTFESSKTNSP